MCFCPLTSSFLDFLAQAPETGPIAGTLKQLAFAQDIRVMLFLLLADMTSKHGRSYTHEIGRLAQCLTYWQTCLESSVSSAYEVVHKGRMRRYLFSYPNPLVRFCLHGAYTLSPLCGYSHLALDTAPV